MPDSRRVICHRECTPPSATRARIVWRSGVISLWVPCNPRWAAQLSPSSHPSNRPIRRLRGSGMPRPPPIPAALQAGPSILRARGRAAGRLRRPAARAVLHGALSLRARPCGRRRSLCTAAFCASVMAALGRSTTIPAASRRHPGRPQRRHAPASPPQNPIRRGVAPASPTPAGTALEPECALCGKPVRFIYNVCGSRIETCGRLVASIGMKVLMT